MSGVLYAGAEQFACGFYVGNEGADAPAPTQAQASAIAARAKTLFASAAPISWAAVVQTVKIAHMGADGATIIPNTQFSSVAGGGQAGSSPRNVAPQLAVAITLRASQIRGTGSKGRFYLPMPNLIPTAQGHMEHADQDAFATAAGTFLTGVNADLAAANVYVINASHGNPAKGEPPVNRKVINVLVGDVIDTIQRRKNHLRESYDIVPVS